MPPYRLACLIRVIRVMRVPDKTYLPFFYVHIKKINTHTSAHTATHTHTSAHTAIRTSIWRS